MMVVFAALCLVVAFLLEGLRRYLHVHDDVVTARRARREKREAVLRDLEAETGFEPSAPWPWRRER